MRLTIQEHGSVIATIPARWTVSVVEQFLREKESWVLHHLRKHKQTAHRMISKAEAARRFSSYQETALRLALERLEHFNRQYHFTYGTVRIRNQSSRWGSCSPENNLSFNYRIALLPEYLADYIIVHELCHVHAHNHGKRFWSLVAETIPDYKACVRQLRTSHRISFY